MNIWTRRFTRSVAIALLLFSLGCSSHPRRVDCEGRLTAINAPAPTAHPKASQP